MAHDILGNMYAGAESAWHLLGIWGKHITSARQAVQDGGMDYSIYKLAPTFAMPDGSTIAMDGASYALWREPVAADPRWVMLSDLVSPDYDYWQNADVADRIDLLAETTGWEFSTAGVIAQGATIFICLKMRDSAIGGEDYGNYFTFIETRDGRTKSWGLVSRIRVVCKNTCNLALRTASGKFGIRHDAEYKDTASWAMDVAAETHRAGNDVDAALNLLTTINMTDEKLSAMLAAVAPMPEMPAILTMPNLTGRMKDRRDAAEVRYDREIKAAGRVRESVAASYASMDIAPALRGTAMHGFQAVTEFTTHRAGTLGSRGRKATAQSRAEMDLIGAGQDMRNAAYTALIGDDM